ncbi:JOKA2-like protein [Drosera capensis]
MADSNQPFIVLPRSTRSRVRVPSPSPVVFKVKLGNTMRRCNVEVDGNKPLDLDLEGLRAKIRTLFVIPPDAAFTMTYVDEDQDVVTLYDDEDLPDIVKQGLNPVRITIHPTKNKDGSWAVVPPCAQSANYNPGRDIVSAEAHDVPSKAANPTVLVEPGNSELKLGKTCLTNDATIETSQEVPGLALNAEASRGNYPPCDQIKNGKVYISAARAKKNFPREQTADSFSRLPEPFIFTKSMPRFGRSWNVMRTCYSRLNSHFVMDVSVLDGTIMAPETPFIKIWRVRNNGNYPWPTGTRLVWISGPKLSHVYSVDLKLPREGLAVNGELEVAVNCTAPKSPGQYRSYWRMESSDGQLFGVVVWVEIEVDSSLMDSEQDNGLGLNSPPVGITCKEDQPVKIELAESPVVHEPEPEISNCNLFLCPSMPSFLITPEYLQGISCQAPPSDATVNSSLSPIPAPAESQLVDESEKIDDNNLYVRPSTGCQNSVTDHISSANVPSNSMPPSDSMLDSSLLSAAAAPADSPSVHEPEPKVDDLNWPVRPWSYYQSSVSDHISPATQGLPSESLVNFSLSSVAASTPVRSSRSCSFEHLHPEYDEEALLKALGSTIEELGLTSENAELISSEESEGESFTEVDSWKEDIDLEEPVVDPTECSDSEWDLVVQESLGFPDDEMNKRVPEKNKGSFMRAMMGFVTGNSE